jgi:hypothetical protein
VGPADVADAPRGKPEVRVVLAMTKAMAQTAGASAGPAGGVKGPGMCDSRATVDIEAGADVGID